MTEQKDVLVEHGYDFDPSHGYDLDALLRVEAPEEPPGFVDFWRQRYAAALAVVPRPRLVDTGVDQRGWQVWEITYTSTRRTEIRGWLLLPRSGRVTRGFVVGHGYGGRTEPDYYLPFDDAALLFPCYRGLGLSRHPRVSGDAQWHVLHNIHDRDRYVIGGCVDDLWVAVTALQRICPETVGHTGYLGVSFGGGIGALGVPWDDRIARAHLCVPTFGNQVLRAKLGSVGSAASVQRFVRKHPRALATLAYYDAAVAARHIRQPIHCACAKFDPFVAPAGQFAVYNALSAEKQLFVLTAGHHAHPGEAAESAALSAELADFFAEL